MTTIILNPRQEDHIICGNSCIFNTQIKQIKGEPKPGDIVEIKSFKRQFVGRGHINPASHIPVRVLTRIDEPIDKLFFVRRIKRALELRKRIINSKTNAYRLVFSESDFLPGLIVDVYGKFCVIQTYTWGMESNLKFIVQTLKELLTPKGIYLRNDSPARLKEGLLLEKRIVDGKFKTKQIVQENGISFVVDMENGQKTGLYLDRRDVRAMLMQNFKGKRVLDCFCYNSAFGAYVLAAGAESVLGIDISAHALKQAQQNMKVNKINSRRYRFKEANVFDELKDLVGHGGQFDMVALDPPNFAGSKNKIDAAVKAYRQINTKAMRLIKKPGMLISSAASYHISDELFKKIIMDSARDAGCMLRQVKWQTQASDHPSFLNKKETLYLKCLFLEVF